MLRILLIITCLFCIALPVNASAEKKASLIVNFNVNGVENDLVRFVRIDFLKGNLISKKNLFTIDVDEAGSFYWIAEDRYILINNGDMYAGKKDNVKPYDLKQDKFVSKEPYKQKNKEVLKKLDSQPKNVPYTYFVKSPDEKKSIDYSNFPRHLNPLIIKIKGQKDVVINQEFQGSTNLLSSNIQTLPLIWIDNKTILTQRKNGSLVIVNIDGTVTPFVEIPCDKDKYPLFKRTKAQILIYRCGSEFKLNLENKSYQKIKEDLDYGFSKVNSLYYYNDIEIGEIGSQEEIIDGYLAITDGKLSEYGSYEAHNIDTVKVWNRFTRIWQTFKFDGSNTEIMGWYFPDKQDK